LEDALDAVRVLNAHDPAGLELPIARAVGAVLDDTDGWRFAIGRLADNSTLIVDDEHSIIGGRFGSPAAPASLPSLLQESPLRSLNPRLMFSRRSGADAASFWSACEKVASDVLGAFGRQSQHRRR
jgi:hypothetical protein